ncbi:hypothetical protein ACN9MY_00290 [Pseudoduganella sp. R-31]|uniref:hypothetical protein n=1 Tax=Pseudoduganella sp. R-31 TaxID=3404060 RepID=UPI003CEBA15D
MSKPQSAAQRSPNLWHFSALVWGTSLLLLSLFAMPISVNPLGMRLQLCLTAVHLGGVFYMWRLARRGNPERLLDIAIITLAFIYIVPLCMLAAPVIVLAAYAMPAGSWLAVIAIMAACGAALALVRLWSTATGKNTGHCFETWLAEQLKGDAITASSLSGLLNHVGRHATEPSRIDGWSMIAAAAAGAPILAASIDYDRAGASLAICALFTTPMAMHAFSRMVVHAYLWIFRLRRFERDSGVKVVVNLRSGS